METVLQRCASQSNFHNSMASNTFCPCGNLALRFCTCQKPSKAYLCDFCLGSHVSKPGAHSLFDVKVNDLLNAELQNARSQCTRQILACIDQISTVIIQEMTSSNEVINDMYQQHCNQILQKYQKAASDIGAVQQELLNTLEKVRENARQLETDLKVQLLPETKSVVHMCWNGEYQGTTMVNLRRETAKIVGDQIGITAAEVVASWGCQRACGNCTSKAAELDLTITDYKDEQPLSLKPANLAPAENWPCKHCGSACNPSITCQSCGAKNAKRSDLVWTCVCGHDLNLKKLEACMKCRRPKPQK